ncbi:GNAT family N-acetyltransferase [Deinococcus arcticus]|uniref:GNAT family N-acetyltransferase n=2 Tax=Deinococcus arcticus TaxID=2136176 RepID=A0A2T3WDA7_9DEIO|nr:GNAT family N-acetyltransferase [Deinococcus arcticus]
MQIRRAQAGDLAQLLGLYRQLSPGSPLMEPEVAQTIWETLLADPKVQVLVGQRRGELMGTVTLVVVPNLTQGGRPYALIENVITREDARGQGVASALMAYATEQARAQSAYKVMLITGRQAPEVHRLYARSGLRTDATAYFARL